MTKEQAKQIVRDAICKFIDDSENDKEIAMTREDKLLLQLNKSICSTIDSLDEEERKVGKWVKSNIGGAKVCSVCQAHMGLSNFKFCPNCGAEMRGAENG